MVCRDEDLGHPRAAAECRPEAGRAVIGVPVRRVPPAVPVVVGETLNILDERGGEADLRAGVGEIEQRRNGRLGIVLVVVDPVVIVEYPKDIALRVTGGDRLVGRLVADGKPGAAVGPVDRLVHMPEVGGVDGGGMYGNGHAGENW